MKIGIHAYAWCTKWSNETLHLIDKCADFGVDFIELPLIDIADFDSQAVRQRLESRNLLALSSTVLSRNTDISSSDSQLRKQGLDYLKRCVECTAEINSNSFSGVIYSEFAKKEQTKAEEENWKYAADSLRTLADFAEKLGVFVGLEPVNRYETNLVNTCEQALHMKRLIGRSNIKIHLDSYHMNIEEKSFYTATKQAGKDLIHFHLCENDRGIPGTGTVNWDDLFRALKEIEYKGYAGLENFVGLSSSFNTWVWRQLAESGDVLLREGIAFVRSMQKKYNIDN